MASELHNVVVDGATGDEVAVLDSYPGGQSVGITASSSGVNTSQIEDLIERAAGQLNALLDAHGMDPGDLGTDETRLVQAGIVAYAVGRTLHRVGRHEEARVYDEEWNFVREELSERPSSLGESREAAPGPRSNVSSTPARKWGKNFKGW